MAWRFYDYRCQKCSTTFESFEDRTAPPEVLPCQSHCDGEAVRIFSAPSIGTNWLGSVNRGKSDERPPGVMDTRALADGKPLSEWKAERKAYWRDKDLAENKKLIA